MDDIETRVIKKVLKIEAAVIVLFMLIIGGMALLVPSANIVAGIAIAVCYCIFASPFFYMDLMSKELAVEQG